MRRGKYFAIPTVIDGIRFASKKEAYRFRELRLLERAGHITGLNLQPRYTLYGADRFRQYVPICTYVGDFEYWEGGTLITEDVKGIKTPAYRLKAKLFAANYGRTIRET